MMRWRSLKKSFMDKEQLKKTQPIVYKTLSNALKRGRLAHAYMFAGPKSANIQQAALLLIQSIFCPHCDEDGFACMECESCKRYAANESVDVQWIDKERIKKQDILDLQERFSATAKEKGGKRIYVLENFDQATPDSSNALLKFLEEPGEDLFGILLVENPNNTLTTIQSRCQLLQFRSGSYHYVKNKLEEITCEENADMLARSGYSYEKAKQLVEEETFEILRDGAKQYVENIRSLMAVYFMQRNVFVAKADITSKEWVRLWLLWVLYLVRQKEQTDLSFEQKNKVISILIETLDLLARPVDLLLCLDKMYASILKACE